MRRRVREAGRRTFRAISVRNYRLYFTGQVISVSGTWMQTVAQAYLILFPLHGTGVDVAIATSLQFLPAPPARPVRGPDRRPPRQAQGALRSPRARRACWRSSWASWSSTHSVTLWEVYVLAAGLGFVNLFDNPARQTFVSEMVGLDLLPNAVSLNSVLMNSARVIGPAIGGVLILTVGVSHLLLHQRRVLRRRHRRARHDAGVRALPTAGRRAGQGPGARRPALRLGHARPARSR